MKHKLITETYNLQCLYDREDEIYQKLGKPHLLVLVGTRSRPKDKGDEVYKKNASDHFMV